MIYSNGFMNNLWVYRLQKFLGYVFKALSVMIYSNGFMNNLWVYRLQFTAIILKSVIELCSTTDVSKGNIYKLMMMMLDQCSNETLSSFPI